MPKVLKKKRNQVGESTKHAPLGQVLMEDESRSKYAVSRSTSNRASAEEDQEHVLLDEKTSARILALGHLQREELELEQQQHQRTTMKITAAANSNSDDEDSFMEEEDELLDDDDDDNIHVQIVRHDEGYVTVDGPGFTADEERLAASIMAGTTEQRRNLADIILAKIRDKELNIKDDQQSMAEQSVASTYNKSHQLPPKVIEVYTDIGKILSRYTAGKLPKAFKVIPSLSNWEEILYLTRPDMWTPQAMYAGTRIFASNLNPKMAQRFYHLVLLDAVRADIEGEKKLNYHYYMSLKKAVYKPAAFFKGILLPLCKKSSNCTLREAAIIASVLQRVSIPVHHSAVAIHKIAQMQMDHGYTGAASIFIKTLLNKKYSLPAPVIGVLVAHFASFTNNHETTSTTSQPPLPVLWHQALLCFVQRYKNEVKDEAREALRVLMKVQFHPLITPEIRRELFGAQAWKDEREQQQE